MASTPLGRDAEAAEFALGVLSGEELLAARARAASDPLFQAEVARWHGRLGGLSDEVDEAPAPERAWLRIERELKSAKGQSEREPDRDNVIVLRRRVATWRAVGSGMTAIAAALAAVLILRPDASVPVSTAAGTPMVAMLENDRKEMAVVASWQPDGRTLVLAAPKAPAADSSHAHELWVIPSGGQPRSLGVLPSAKQMHMELAAELAELMRQGATIAISLEPRGGSASGAPTGPVVASGTLSAA